MQLQASVSKSGVLVDKFNEIFVLGRYPKAVKKIENIKKEKV